MMIINIINSFFFSLAYIKAILITTLSHINFKNERVNKVYISFIKHIVYR